MILHFKNRFFFLNLQANWITDFSILKSHTSILANFSLKCFQFSDSITKHPSLSWFKSRKSLLRSAFFLGGGNWATSVAVVKCFVCWLGLGRTILHVDHMNNICKKYFEIMLWNHLFIPKSYQTDYRPDQQIHACVTWHAHANTWTMCQCCHRSISTTHTLFQRHPHPVPTCLCHPINNYHNVNTQLIYKCTVSKLLKCELIG